MSQTISNTIHENVSETKALRTALSMGACGGIAIGPAVIVSIVANIYFVCSIVKGPNGLDDFVSIEFNLLCLTIGIWLFIAVLCGRRAAKKTGLGAEIGAYSGCFFGLTSVVSAAVSALLLCAFVSPYPVGLAIQPLLGITTLLACIASGIGALFGALGGRISHH
jgi:hypothetical protein